MLIPYILKSLEQRKWVEAGLYPARPTHLSLLLLVASIFSLIPEIWPSFPYMMMSPTVIAGRESVLAQSGRSICPQHGWYVDIASSCLLESITDVPYGLLSSLVIRS